MVKKKFLKMDQSNRPLDERLGDKAEKCKEDFKGTARRVEGELKGDEGLKSEHDPSMLERAGESIKQTAQAASEKVSETAQNWGLTSKNTALDK